MWVLSLESQEWWVKDLLLLANSPHSPTDSTNTKEHKKNPTHKHTELVDKLTHMRTHHDYIKQCSTREKRPKGGGEWSKKKNGGRSSMCMTITFTRNVIVTCILVMS